MKNDCMNQIPQMKRVDSVDALRGFAVVAIMLLHFVEHFIYGVYPEATSKTAELLNQSVWDALFFILPERVIRFSHFFSDSRSLSSSETKRLKAVTSEDVSHGGWSY